MAQRDSVKQSKLIDKLGYRDYFVILLISISCFIVSIFNLGATSSPQNGWNPKINDQVKAEFRHHANITAIVFFNGCGEGKDFSIEFSDDGTRWEPVITCRTGQIFRWEYKNIDTNREYSYIRVTSKSESLSLMEMFFLSGDNVIAIEGGDAPLFDEQSKFIQHPSFLNEAYSDEFFYASTAYQYIHMLGPDYVENTHPPLGKNIIAAGELIFGATPFGWRFFGVVAGVLSLAVLYILAKRLFGGLWWPAFSMALFALDFIRFTQTRFGTVDSYVVLFALLSFLYMFLYYKADHGNAGTGKLWLYLFASGIFMGLGAAVKWEALYAVPGFAILFFSGWRRQKKYIISTILMCFVFFIFMPMIIYSLSYIPYVMASGESVVAVIKNQFMMLWFHTQLMPTGISASRWWQWPVTLCPLLYYSGYVGGAYWKILLWGNPFIWLPGLISVAITFAGCIYGWVSPGKVSLDDKKTGCFISIAYFSLLLPWALVSRDTYLYHYFPCVPFMILALAFAIRRFFKINRFLSISLIIMAFVMFLVFYPILSGLPTEYDYMASFINLMIK